MEVLLHTCCAPCSAAIVERMMAEGDVPVIYYYNPNIFPEEEYQRRKDECTRFCRSLGLTIIDADYDHEQWLQGVQGLEHEPERGRRCTQCFLMRLTVTARYAAAHGYSVIATTLASSRWKNIDQINEAGRLAAQSVEGVTFLERNWRKGGLQERRNTLIKQYGFYNQQYCGCEFSFR